MATLAHVKKQALIKLGVATPHQAPKSYQDDEMQIAYNEVYTKLENKTLAFWAKTGPVPDEVVNDVASMMAWTRANDYGISSERYQRLANERARAEPNIRYLSVNRYLSVDEPEDF